MANIVKKVDRGIPSNQRVQTFNETDAGTGDVIRVKESLGKSARTLIIDAEANMSVRLNVQRTLFPITPASYGYDGHWQNETRVLASGVDYEDTTQGLIDIPASTTFSLDDDLPVDDIKIVTASGVFNIFVA